MIGLRLLIHLGLFLCLFPLSMRAEEARVAVAANFKEPLERLRLEFQKDSEHLIRISAASTGKLYAQVQHGAPFDVLLAADQERPRKLEAAGLAEEGTRFTYALGRLALWSADPDRVFGDGERTLREGAFRKLAIANPELAPYGVAAVQVLRGLGIREEVSDRLVMGENISQAFAFVATGNADLGLVALSHVLAYRSRNPGSCWEVPATHHEPIRQDAVLLTRASTNPAARAFLEFLQSDTARNVIQSFGYGVE